MNPGGGEAPAWGWPEKIPPLCGGTHPPAVVRLWRTAKVRKNFLFNEGAAKIFPSFKKGINFYGLWYFRNRLALSPAEQDWKRFNLTKGRVGRKVIHIHIYCLDF